MIGVSPRSSCEIKLRPGSPLGTVEWCDVCVTLTLSGDVCVSIAMLWVDGADDVLSSKPVMIVTLVELGLGKVRRL